VTGAPDLCHRERRLSTYAVTQISMLALAAAACGGGGDDRVEPADAVVAIGATGCRRTPTRADGVVVADDLVATVAHAIAGESEIRVTGPDGRDLPGEVVAIDTQLDAAVVRVDGLDLAALDRGELEQGEAVTLWTSDHGVVESAPAEVRRRVTVRTTDIYREGEHLRPGLELQADVRAGDSGGGLVDADGELVGIVWATSRERDDRAWAMPIEALDPLLAAAMTGDPVAPVECAR
jgi:S1-C subfamily serine protease